MNGPQSILLSNFKSPELEPVGAGSSFIFLVLNILTLGIYGAAEKLSKQHRVKELHINQDKLHDQIIGITGEWDVLETNLSELLSQFKDMDNEETFSQKGLKSRVKTLSGENDKLNDKELSEESRLNTTVSEVALGIFAFLGQLFANIVTIGLYGVYMNYSLKNQITVLEAQNDHIKVEFNAEKNKRYDKVNRIIDCFEANLEKTDKLHSLQVELDAMASTEKGQAYQELQKAKQDLDDLQNRQEQVQKDLTALRVQRVAAEQAKKNLEKELGDAQTENDALLLSNQAQANKATTLAEEKKQLAKDISQKDAQLVAKANEIRDLQSHIKLAKQKAADVLRLQNEVERLKGASKHQPEVQKLQAQLGPIDPKYTPRKDEDGEISGAMDLDDLVPDELEQEWIDFAKEYNARYSKARTAAEVITASFNHSFEQLIDMAEKGDKIKLNKSSGTSGVEARFAILRNMVLDMVKGAKLTENGCHGFQLKINSNVNMLPSQPEKVLQFKNDASGALKPVVIMHHKLRDDFTPDEETLAGRQTGVYNGVDPVSVKWILEQLTKEEEAHLFNLLMSPVIENEHEDLVKAKDYLRKSARFPCGVGSNGL